MPRKKQQQAMLFDELALFEPLSPDVATRAEPGDEIEAGPQAHHVPVEVQESADASPLANTPTASVCDTNPWCHLHPLRYNGPLVVCVNAAREAGLALPAFLTETVWSLVEDIPAERAFETVDGRLYNVLWTAHGTAERELGYPLIHKLAGRECPFGVLLSRSGPDASAVECVTLTLTLDAEGFIIH